MPGFAKFATGVIIGTLIGIALTLSYSPPEPVSLIDNKGDVVAVAVDYEHLATFEYRDGEWTRTTYEFPPMRTPR